MKCKKRKSGKNILWRGKKEKSNMKNKKLHRDIEGCCIPFMIFIGIALTLLHFSL